MSLKDDLTNKVSEIVGSKWNVRNGQKIPDTESISLGTDAVKINATVLYADLNGTTKMVDTKKIAYSAAVYKTYLHCASKIIRANSGVIKSFDGDRIMGVFFGESQNTNAVKAAMQIEWARLNIILPEFKKCWNGDYTIDHTIGIDRSDLYAVRTGIRNNNDLVWIGSAANHAAKLGDLKGIPSIRITKEVYDYIHDSVKFHGFPRIDMWKKWTWNDMGRAIYTTTFHWSIP